MAGDAAALIAATVNVASAGLYFWVGRLVLGRELSGASKGANMAFACWWMGLGALYLLIPAYSVPPRVFGYENLPLAVTLLNLVFVLLVAAMAGLVYYLVYLYTGSSRALVPIVLFYAALGFVLLYLIAWLQPIGYKPDGTLEFARQQLPGAPSLALGLMFSLPVIAAALAYGSLFFRVRAPGPRYRIALVAGAFLVQFGWSFVSTLLQLSRRYPGSLTLTLVGNAFGIAAAIAILLAFRPPRALERRLGLSPA